MLSLTLYSYATSPPPQYKPFHYFYLANLAITSCSYSLNLNKLFVHIEFSSLCRIILQINVLNFIHIFLSTNNLEYLVSSINLIRIFLIAFFWSFIKLLNGMKFKSDLLGGGWISWYSDLLPMLLADLAISCLFYFHISKNDIWNSKYFQGRE